MRKRAHTYTQMPTHTHTHTRGHTSTLQPHNTLPKQGMNTRVGTQHGAQTRDKHMQEEKEEEENKEQHNTPTRNDAQQRGPGKRGHRHMNRASKQRPHGNRTPHLRSRTTKSQHPTALQHGCTQRALVKCTLTTSNAHKHSAARAHRLFGPHCQQESPKSVSILENNLFLLT